MWKEALAVIFALLTFKAHGNQKAFSVTDDIFAYPQYDISFSTSYIEEDAANDLLSLSESNKDKDAENDLRQDLGSDRYQRMILDNRPYLCSIPYVQQVENSTEEKLSEDDQKKELARAADRGWELLQDMEGKQCLYYSTGWWSYSFCYNSQVKQFHSLQPGTNGARVWPPQEDPTTPSYVLGKYAKSSKPEKETGLQTKAQTSYLVQMLENGTPCDLTGENRKVEIEFHCHPQSTDRIGWIKETATCAYLMIIYTPRLCNDVAFQPAKGAQAHTISCQHILTAGEVDLIGKPDETIIENDQRIMVGRIEIGAMKHIGLDGKKIERGKVVMTADERAEVVIMQKDGQIRGMSGPELKKLDLNPDEVDAFRRDLQKLAGKKDWKIERLDGADGQIQLRGSVTSDDDDDTDDETQGDTGSEEKYKQEL